MCKLEQNKTSEIMDKAQGMVQEEIPKDRPREIWQLYCYKKTGSQLAELLYVTNKAVCK